LWCSCTARATPSFDKDGRVVKWFGTSTDIEDRKRAECLLAGENRVLEMTAKGSSLESIIEPLMSSCRTDRQWIFVQRHFDRFQLLKNRASDCAEPSTQL
jgi:hypothetical protein